MPSPCLPDCDPFEKKIGGALGGDVLWRNSLHYILFSTAKVACEHYKNKMVISALETFKEKEFCYIFNSNYSFPMPPRLQRFKEKK